MRILVTGGLGFIGSAVVRHLIDHTDHHVFNLDKISYASTEGSVASVSNDERYWFRRCDLANRTETARTVSEVDPEVIVHLAAESHVDRSIDGPQDFIDANVVGTFNLLEAARNLGDLRRIVHVSTDEVFGSLDLDDGYFDEHSAYRPRSPYAATKAASDHLVRAWGETYDLPVIITNCSNNYGPYQFPEKMIPLMIIKCQRGESLPVYGRGLNVRDWLHVADHAAALAAVVERGRIGRSYTIGGGSERHNIDVVLAVCGIMNQLADDDVDRRSLIEFVPDRPGHDLRYAVDNSRIRAELGWEPTHDFEGGLAATVDWYLENGWWWEPLLERPGAGRRLGLQTVG